MNKKLSLNQVDLKDQKVLVRVDFNVPMDEHGFITDDTRIRAALPSIQYLIKNGASLILMSHLGRPKGKVTPSLSLKPCAIRLGELLDMPVGMSSDSIGPQVKKEIQELKSGEILMLENLRFYDAEESPDKNPDFAKTLASYADLYVNDAFGTAHRAHSSTSKVAEYFPSASAAGYLLEKEIHFLGNALLKPKRPFYAIIGGAKVSTKLGVLKSLLEKADGLILGGGMIFTFLKSQGIGIGNSLVEEDFLDQANSLLKLSKEMNKPLILPQDIVIGNKFSNDAERSVISTKEGIPEGFLGMDIGPKTAQQIKSFCSDAATIFWNGPLGVVEFSQFAKGTQSVAQSLAEIEALKIVGGGDSIAAINSMGLQHGFSHLSTGGGAAIEYIEFGTLPGLEVLTPSPTT